MNKTPQNIIDATKRWQTRNPEKVKQLQKQWTESGKSKQFYQENRIKLLQRNAQYTEKLRIKAIQLYGGHCKICKIDDLDCLVVDHINNDGFKNKQRGHSYWKMIIQENNKSKYQVLCHNHNWKKHINNLKNKNYGSKK